jgi:hypothetical protein
MGTGKINFECTGVVWSNGLEGRSVVEEEISGFGGISAPVVAYERGIPWSRDRVWYVFACFIVCIILKCSSMLQR